MRAFVIMTASAAMLSFNAQADTIIVGPSKLEIMKFNECLRGKHSEKCVMPKTVTLAIDDVETLAKGKIAKPRTSCDKYGAAVPHWCLMWNARNRDEERADDGFADRESSVGRDSASGNSSNDSNSGNSDPGGQAGPSEPPCRR